MPPINQNSSSFVLLDEIKQNTLEELYDKVVDLYDKKLMSKEDLTKVNEALVTVNQVFLKQEKANFTVRQATLADVDSLMDMIEYWAKQDRIFLVRETTSSVVFRHLLSASRMRRL